MEMKVILASVFALAALATSVSALTVASGTTQAGDTDNIELVGPDTSIISPGHFSGFGSQPGAEWVWAPGAFANTSHSFSFSFDLTGYDLNTAQLSGIVLVDNTVDILLNGTSFFSLLNQIASNYSTQNPFSTSDTSLFLAGVNEVIFNAADAGGAYGFNASITVSASPASAVPLPAGLPLLLAGLGGLVLMRRRSAAQ
jgi:hypothetical protein